MSLADKRSITTCLIDRNNNEFIMQHYNSSEIILSFSFNPFLLLPIVNLVKPWLSFSSIVGITAYFH